MLDYIFLLSNKLLFYISFISPSIELERFILKDPSRFGDENQTLEKEKMENRV